MQRRNFLKTGGLATASLFLPKFLTATTASGALSHRGRSLVMIQLSGGNDGLNLVVPYRNDIYYRERSGLAIKREEALRMTDEAGLHPALTALKSSFDQGEMAILNSVGYPNPDRSHFRSMDIWHTGSASDQYWTSGWLGRYLDAYCAGRPSAGLEIDDTLSLAMKGEKNKGLALQNTKRLYDSVRQPMLDELVTAHTAHAHAAAPVDYLYKTLAETQASAAYLHEQYGKNRSTAVYPTTELGKHLKTIASLILSDTDTSVYYVSLGSFDTHINQNGQQRRLFDELNGALAAFTAEMKANGKWNDVLVCTFSEFGRRVAQNASGGTDHGTANNMLMFSGGLQQKGLLNDLPDLSDLEDGDLKYHIDFRRVYATILEKWLDADAKSILGEPFKTLDFLA
ncbi:MAG: DUF1501 domain-containing protein [Saprospiraceae bacterium]|nr:DUF1501 domain-containing protein [Saprospiraceae bacterium]